MFLCLDTILTSRVLYGWCICRPVLRRYLYYINRRAAAALFNGYSVNVFVVISVRYFLTTCATLYRPINNYLVVFFLLYNIFTSESLAIGITLSVRLHAALLYPELACDTVEITAVNSPLFSRAHLNCYLYFKDPHIAFFFIPPCIFLATLFQSASLILEKEKKLRSLYF